MGHAQVEKLLCDSQPELFAFLLARLGHREEALDTLQDVLLSLWRRRDTLSRLSSRERLAYLYRSARNRAVDALRAHRNRQCRNQPLEGIEGARIPATARADERVDRLDRLISRLSPSDRVLVYLIYAGGLNCREIAERLGRPAGTIRSRLTRLRQRLRSQMEEAEHAKS